MDLLFKKNDSSKYAFEKFVEEKQVLKDIPDFSIWEQYKDMTEMEKRSRHGKMEVYVVKVP